MYFPKYISNITTAIKEGKNVFIIGYKLLFVLSAYINVLNPLVGPTDNNSVNSIIIPKRTIKRFRYLNK